MKLTWMKYPAGGWSQLNDLNLRAPQFDNLEGVYVIWHGVETGAYVRVGQGKIREKLQFHKMDPEVQAFKALSLFVTWTSVLEKFRDGVEAFLVKELRPKLAAVADLYCVRPNTPPTIWTPQPHHRLFSLHRRTSAECASARLSATLSSFGF